MKAFTYPILLLNAIEAFIEFVFALAMIEAFKTKKLEVGRYLLSFRFLERMSSF